MSVDVFSDFRYRYEKAVRENNIGEKDAILKRWAWFASRPWVSTVPDWVLALGIKPGAAAAAAVLAKPQTWVALVAMFTDLSADVDPTARSPKAWAAIDTLIGRSARGLIVSAGLSVVQQRLALDVVWPLVIAADAIESSLSPGATETVAHVVWRSDLAAVNALIADIDGGSPTGATAYELEQRLALARSNPSLPAGKATLARAISVPSEPTLDSALRGAAEAFRLFFT